MNALIECPVEGCEYEGELQQVSSHANASPDHPNWSEINHLVDPPEERSQRDGDEEQSESSNGDTTSTPSEEAPEEGSDEGSTDSDQDDTDSMDDDQWTKATNPAEEDQDTDTDQEDNPEDVEGGIPIPVSSTVVFWAVGLLVTAFILYQFIQSDSPETDAEDVEIESEETDESVAAEGGLIEG